MGVLGRAALVRLPQRRHHARVIDAAECSRRLLHQRVCTALQHIDQRWHQPRIRSRVERRQHVAPLLRAQQPVGALGQRAHVRYQRVGQVAGPQQHLRAVGARQLRERLSVLLPVPEALDVRLQLLQEALPGLSLGARRAAAPSWQPRSHGQELVRQRHVAVLGDAVDGGAQGLTTQGPLVEQRAQAAERRAALHQRAAPSQREQCAHVGHCFHDDGGAPRRHHLPHERRVRERSG
ncbi:MAG: hypothetical protein IPL19_20535 [Sandaracinaceae bacterium]|nr:hypothetical protein [Sandaracinaceae bacterium]